jgi:hypothetical protein
LRRSSSLCSKLVAHSMSNSGEPMKPVAAMLRSWQPAKMPNDEPILSLGKSPNCLTSESPF